MPTAANDLNISEIGFQSFDGVAFFKGRTLSAGTGISITNGTGVSGNPVISATGAGFPWTDVSGAVSASVNNGYFVTATCTSTLPSAPSQGDTIKYIVDNSSQVLTIQASAGKFIRLGNTVTAAAGTAVSTLQGDSIELVYRASDLTWFALASVGQWNLT